jgi:hypothetical protein
MWISKDKYGYETYTVANEITSPIGAEIVVNPKEGRLFEVEIWGENHNAVVDPEVGFHYEHDPQTLESDRDRAPIITVEGVKEALGRHGIELPDDLAEKLSAHEKAHEVQMRESRLEYESEAGDLAEVEYQLPEDLANALKFEVYSMTQDEYEQLVDRAMEKWENARCGIWDQPAETGQGTSPGPASAASAEPDPPDRDDAGSKKRVISRDRGLSR